MKNNLISLTVGLAVAIIIIGSVMMPTIQDATTTHTLFKNEGIYYMTDTDESLTYEYLGGTSWTVNGETLENVDAYSNIIVANGTYIRGNGQVRGEISQTMTAAELTVSDGTITGTATISSTPTAINWDCSETFYGAVMEETDLLMKSAGTDVYVLGSDVLYGLGLTPIGSEGYVTFEISVVDETATVTASNSSVVISDISLNWESVDGYVDLYKFTSVTFKATLNETTVNVTYNRIIVPASANAELSYHMTDAEISLTNIIPILIILAIVVFAAYAITRRD